jgi:hypothetical protein
MRHLSRPSIMREGNFAPKAHLLTEALFWNECEAIIEPAGPEAGPAGLIEWPILLRGR